VLIFWGCIGNFRSKHGEGGKGERKKRPGATTAYTILTIFICLKKKEDAARMPTSAGGGKEGEKKRRGVRRLGESFSFPRIVLAIWGLGLSHTVLEGEEERRRGRFIKR